MSGEGRRRGRPLRGAVAVASAAVVLAVSACGGDGDAKVTEPPEPSPSAGCGTSRVTAGEQALTLMSGGVSRLYLQHVPPAHDGRHPVPVIIDLHGFNEGAVAHADYTQLGSFGDERGFVTVTPQGRGELAAWDSANDSVDVAFVDDLLDRVEASLCVDVDRIYVTGVSNGAMLASTLACVSSDRIAAIAPVAGVAAVDGCEPERPVPVVAFHGTADPVVLFDGGFGPGVASLPIPGDDGSIGASQPLSQLSVPEIMAYWASLYDCDGNVGERRVATDVVLVDQGCPDEAAVELYRVEGGGHTWPGAETAHLAEPLASAVRSAGRTSPASANELMWAFFQAHPRTAVR